MSGRPYDIRLDHQPQQSPSAALLLSNHRGLQASRHFVHVGEEIHGRDQSLVRRPSGEGCAYVHHTYMHNCIHTSTYICYYIYSLSMDSITFIMYLSMYVCMYTNKILGLCMYVGKRSDL